MMDGGEGSRITASSSHSAPAPHLNAPRLPPKHSLDVTLCSRLGATRGIARGHSGKRLGAANERVPSMWLYHPARTEAEVLSAYLPDQSGERPSKLYPSGAKGWGASRSS